MAFKFVKLSNWKMILKSRNIFFEKIGSMALLKKHSLQMSHLWASSQKDQWQVSREYALTQEIC